MTDGSHYPGRPLQRHSLAASREVDPRRGFGQQQVATTGHERLLMGSHVQQLAYPGGPGRSPNNPGKGGDSPQESFASNRYPQSQKVYFPSANDLRLGAQGYSSCSDREQPDETISRSGHGADTYAGHLPSSNYGYGDQPSTKRSSKAYGMENGNWLGMDASIQNTTLQDTTCLKNLSRDDGLNNYKNWSNQDIADSNPSRGRGDWLPLGGQAAVNRSNQNPNTRVGLPRRPPPSLDSEGSPLPARMVGRVSPERNVLRGLHPAYAPAKGSTPLDDTLQLMNQTQNKTIYQVTQSGQRRGASGHVSAGGDYFKQVWTPRKDEGTAGTGSTPKRFNLTFKVFYKTDYGESLQVVGSIEELGAWKDYKCPLKWTEGHIWVSETLSIKSCSHFTYKYVVMYQEKAVKWERGPHRIADLVILPDVSRLLKPKEQNSFSASPDSRYSGKRSHYSLGMNSVGLPPGSAAAGGRYSPHNNIQPQPAAKNVELRDHWEQFTIRFSVFAPVNMSTAAEGGSLESNKEYMRIIGSVAELTKSGTIESGPKRMKKSSKKFRWFFDKYGQEMCPWECQVTLKTSDFIETRELIYSYSKSDHAQRDYIYEREPSRIIKLQPPETYRGELGAQRSSQWRNWDKVWIVNGHVEKVDGNFLGELFYTKVGETGICLGTYPLEDQDVHRLYQAGITGVLNVMTLNDLQQRGVQLRQIQRSYEERGMKCVKYPVNDIKDKDLQSNLFIAAQHLNNMVNLLGLNVYVHCTSGLTRAPAVILAYLCLFKKIKCWQTPDEALKYIRAFNPKLNPNMRIIKKCIEANKEFQMNQSESQSQNKRLLDSLEDSFYFPNMIIEESNHHPMKLEKLLDIANQIQEEEESFDTNQGPDGQPSQISVHDPSPSPLHNRVDLSVIKPTAPPILLPANSPERTGKLATPRMDGPVTGSSRQQTFEGTPTVSASIDESQIQKKIDEEVALKLSQKLDGLREQIIQEQEEKMRQAIQEAMKLSQQQQRDQESAEQKWRAQQELEEEKVRAQKRLEEEEARRLEAVQYLQEEAERAKQAREQEERRTRQLELEIEQLKLREQERLRAMQCEKERLEQEVQQAKNEKEARDLELEQRQEREELLQKREQQAKLEAEQLTHKLREEMEQKMKENLEKIMQEQMRQSMQQEQEQKQRELKIEQEKKDIEELLRKQKLEEEQRKEDKMLRKKQKQEERDRQQQQLEAEKRELSQQMLQQQEEISRLQASLNHEAERIKAFECLEQSHKSLSRLEQTQREAEQKQAVEVVEQLRKELQDQQERQQLVEATTQQQLQQKDEMLRQIEKAKEDDLRKEAEARQRQEQLLKMEMESKLAAEQLAEAQRRAMQQLQLQLAREKEQAETVLIQEQQRALEKEEKMQKEIELEKEKRRLAAAEVESLQKQNESQINQSREQSASLYYRATSGTELEELSSPIAEANELPEPEEHVEQFQVKKRRDRRNRDRSGSRPRAGQDNTKRTNLPQIDNFVADDANPSDMQPQVSDANDVQEERLNEEPQQNSQGEGSKSGLTRLAEEEQLFAAERLQKIKKKKEENALRQAQIEQQEREMKDLEQRKRAQEQQLEELRRMRELERQRQEETRRRIAQEQTKSALKAVVDDLLQEHLRREIGKLCQNRIEVETEVQNVLRQREHDETEASHKHSQDNSDQQEDAISQRIQKKETQKPSDLRMTIESSKDGSYVNRTLDESKNQIVASEEEIQRIRNLRILEEEKLNLLRLAKEVEDQRSILKSKHSLTELTLNQSLAAQVQEIPDPRIVTGQSKRDHRPVEDESLQLDYQREEKGDMKVYGLQERQAEFSAAKSQQLYGSPQADPARSPEAHLRAELMTADGRGTAETRGCEPSERSYARDSINLGAGGQNRASLFPQSKNRLDLTDLQFEQMCDEFFSNGPPIKFKARRGVKVEEQIQKILKKEKITVPVIHVRASIYLIGAQKCICELKGDLVMVKPQGVSAGVPQRLQKYLVENEKAQQLSLCKLMLQSKMAIDEVCQALIKGQKIGDESKQLPQIGLPTSSVPQAASTTPQASRVAPGRFSSAFGQPMERKSQVVRRPSDANQGAPGQRTNASMSRQAVPPSKAPGDSHQRTSVIAPWKPGPTAKGPASRSRDPGDSLEPRLTTFKSGLGANDVARAEYLVEGNDVRRSPARRLRASRPAHVAPVKQLSLALVPGSQSSSQEPRRLSGRQGPTRAHHGPQLSRAGEQPRAPSAVSQDASKGNQIRGIARTKWQQPTPTSGGKRLDPSLQLYGDESPVRRSQPFPANQMARSRKGKPSIVPERQTQVNGQPGRATSSRPHPRQSPPASMQTQRAGAARAYKQTDGAPVEESGHQSYRGSDAPTVHRPEVQRGDYSFRSNLDLFEKQYQQSRVLPDQSSILDSPDGDDPKNAKAQMAQLGYLNALNQFSTADGSSKKTRGAQPQPPGRTAARNPKSRHDEQDGRAEYYQSKEPTNDEYNGDRE